MSKWEVLVYGKVPDCIEVEAGSEEEALDFAYQEIIEKIELRAAPCEEKPCCQAANEPTPPRAKKRRKLDHVRSPNARPHLLPRH